MTKTEMELEPMEPDLARLAQDIDAATDRGDAEALVQLGQRCMEWLETSHGKRTSKLWYFRSNVHAALQQLQEERSWKWRQSHRERTILYLRRARNEPAFRSLNPIERAQVTTNLARNLGHFGRSVEAIALYDATLRDTPRFAIALGNRGLARIEFARALDEQNDKIFSFLAALKDLKGALASDAVWDADYPEARAAYAEAIENIEAMFEGHDVSSLEDLKDNYPFGRTKQERAYRHWALHRQLFLNPLNVLGTHTCAATDHFSLPGYRAPLDEPPQFIAWFNQLKQEFSAARTLLFEADGGMSAHYSDRKLWLADTLDYSVFGFSLEKMRLAFRVAYGLLDKVAGFVNAYFKLQEQPDRVNFRNVWLTKDRKSVRAEFTEHPNWPLRGLYWLAFDILEKKNGDDPDAISPEAEDLYRLRNALEHRCLSLHELLVDNEIPSILERTTVTHFQERTLLMLRLARSSLIYLSMAVGAEERLRARSDKGRHVPMTLPTYRGHLR